MLDVFNLNSSDISESKESKKVLSLEGVNDKTHP